MIARTAIIVVAAAFVWACEPPAETPDPTPAAPAALPADALDRAIQVHGGLDRFRSFGTLEYDVQLGDRSEHHLVDLHSRMVLITADQYTIGFDGTDAWVHPDMEAYGGRNPRFYSSLYFYFFGLPFLLADPGTIREDLGPRSVGEKSYDVVKVGFGGRHWRLAGRLLSPAFRP